MASCMCTHVLFLWQDTGLLHVAIGSNWKADFDKCTGKCHHTLDMIVMCSLSTQMGGLVPKTKRKSLKGEEPQNMTGSLRLLPSEETNVGPMGPQLVLMRADYYEGARRAPPRPDDHPDTKCSHCRAIVQLLGCGQETNVIIMLNTQLPKL